MPFICAFCQKSINSGEHVVTDGVSSIAHDHCVRKEIETQKPTPVRIPSVTVTPDPSVEAARAAAFKMAHNIPVPVAEARAAYAEPCLLPSAPKVCVECQKPAISMCPCGAIIHHDFGYNGINCSGRHEAKCAYAAASRELPKKPPTVEKVQQDLFAKLSKSSNGKHQKNASKPKKGSSR